ncbi:hypothetical protein SUGI_0898760 [Cryptomeria japonica]|uniref:uncharacterized protein LOC131062803 n=1 Tax=Cryptomeria japonica TaxID=3369 RepID=UPI002414BCCC|nr:uncharacterized protein LOC131062803 [Cryptomeria japonica]GLJ43282.1 hypothetical protein SUGI_0898760 [Cryptomeria japonica]
MSNVLEKLQEQVEKVQMLGLQKPEMFEAVRDPSLLRDAFQKIDQHHLGDCSDMRPVAQVSKHVRDLYSLLVAERDAILNEESNQAEPKVEMREDGNGWRLHVSSLKWEGAITSILETIESMGLTVVQANISCDKLFVFDAFLQEETEAVEGNVNELSEKNRP